MGLIIKIASSFYATLVMFVLMAAYLVSGKYFGCGLDPRIMLTLAGLLILQSAVVCAGRWRYLKQFESLQLPDGTRGQRGEFPGESATATKILTDAGFTPLNGGNGAPVCYGKRVRLAVALEMIACGGLLFTLICGVINFGMGIRGFLMVGPGTAWVEMSGNLQKVQQGFLVDKSVLAMKMKISELKNATERDRAQIRFEAVSGGNSVNYLLKRGDSTDIGKLKLRFLGDTYMVFSYVTRNGLDLQAEPIYLHPDGQRGYVSPLKLHQPGTSGELIYVPETDTFRILLNNGGVLGLDQQLKQGEVAKQGGYEVQITGVGHFGRIDVWRHNYRNLIFADLVALILACVSRLICRPMTVWLWSENGRTLFHTRSRSSARLLTDGMG
jgi:hypothetical protein